MSTATTTTGTVSMATFLYPLFWDRTVAYTIRTAVVFGSVLVLLRLWATSKYRNLPPGPLCLPIIGFLPFLGPNYHLKLTELSRTFGSVYHMFLGTKRIIVLNDPVLIREAFTKKVFTGRPDTELTKLLEGYGIIHSAGALWKEQRTFFHEVLRKLGAKNVFKEDSILENTLKVQVSKLLLVLDQENGAPYRVRNALARAVTNVVGMLLMSRTYAADDETFEGLLKLIEEGFSLVTMSASVNFIPLLRYIPCANYAYWKIKRNKQETSSYFRREAERHRANLNNEENAKDFVDHFLIRQKAVLGSNKPSYFSEEQLIQVMGDIFSAGLETVTSTVEWSLVYMLRNPDVQQRIQKELDEVVGESRMPSLSDKPQLVYTHAAVLETLRRGNIVALGNSHSALEDAEIAGFFVPKHSHVLPNLWAVHMDPALWDDPERFNPERFIVNGKVTQPRCFLPFSSGRRMCVGNVLAQMEAFMFLASILHVFELRVPEGEEPPSLEGTPAASMTAKPFNLCAIPRKDLSKLLNLTE